MSAAQTEAQRYTNMKTRVKVQVFSLKVFKVFKSADLSADFKLYPLVIEHVHSCSIPPPRKAYSPAAISAHSIYCTHCHLCQAVPGTHLHLSQVKHHTFFFCSI